MQVTRSLIDVADTTRAGEVGPARLTRRNRRFFISDQEKELRLPMLIKFSKTFPHRVPPKFAKCVQIFRGSAGWGGKEGGVFSGRRQIAKNVKIKPTSSSKVLLGFTCKTPPTFEGTPIVFSLTQN